MKLFTLYCAMLWASVCSAQTTLNGDSLAYHSTGSSFGTSWILDRDGYLGTFIKLAAPGNVTIGVNATGTPAGGINPHVSVVIADTIRGFDVTSGTTNSTFALPAGTFFVRTQFDNDLALTARQVTVNSLTVSGATVANAATSANALAASDTYIANYRKGNVTINLARLRLPAGTPVNVSMKRIAFNWGTAVPGHESSDVNDYLGNNGTAEQVNYQSRLNQNFNAVTEENAAKWWANEPTRGDVLMQGPDQIINYAQTHDMTSRLHNMIWDAPDAEPPWVNSLHDTLTNGSLPAKAAAKADLRNAVTSRINYYIAPRTSKVVEIDVYNESRFGEYYYQTPSEPFNSYWTDYGASGIAGIYNEAKQAAGNAKVFVNDFWGLEWISSDPNHGTQGFIHHIEDIKRAGGAVDGVGIQNYVFTQNPSDVIASLQNYSVLGLSQSMTEFGVWPDSPDPADKILDESMRLEFGNPAGTGFYMWGFHAEDGGGNLYAKDAALYTVDTSDWNNWTLTPAGKVWQDRLGIADWDGISTNGWNTQLSKQLAADGTINFDGYYGDYVITAGGQNYNLSLTKGTTSYAIGGLAGDINADGVVDARDYVAWRKMGGSYATWRANFGRSATLAAAVPEASVLVLVGQLICIGAWPRRRWRGLLYRQ